MATWHMDNIARAALAIMGSSSRADPTMIGTRDSPDIIGVGPSVAASKETTYPYP